MKIFYLLRCRAIRLLSVSALALNCLPAFAAPLQPGSSLLADPQFQACLDKAVIANGWVATEEVTSLSCPKHNIENLDGIQTFTNLVELNLAGNRILTVWPLDQLPQLNILDLSDNPLVDIYPLLNMYQLTKLNLSGNSHLSPLDVRTIVQNNSRLTHVNVANIAMGDLNWLPPIGPQGEYDLIELDISYTGSFVDLYPLTQYPNLRVLKSAGNQLKIANPLDQLVQLEVLDLSDNQLIDVYPLVNFNTLTQLNLSGNSRLQALDVQNVIRNNLGLTHIGVANITMGDLNWLPPIGPQGEYNLVELDISYTGSFVDLYPLTQYANLRVLKAAGNALQIAYPLDQLVKLEILDLSDNQLIDVNPLLSINTLTQLNLSGNSGLQALEVQNIIQNNPGLSHIGVANITMGDLNWLPAMGPQGEYNLIELDISHTGALFELSPLQQYTNLRVLKAAGNELQISYSLDQLTQLEILDLSDNSLLDINPLLNLYKLTQLNLSGNSKLPALEVQRVIQNNAGLTHIGVANITMGDLNWLPAMGPQGEYNLVELDISHMGSLVDLNPLTQYSNLRVLKAVGNQLEFAYPLDLLTQLEILDLSDNKLIEVNALQNLHQLTQLNLSGNSQLQAFDVQNIVQNNPGLTHIGVANISMGDLNWLPPMGVQGEYDLLALDISNTGSIFDLSVLQQYTKLRVLKAAGIQLQTTHTLGKLVQLEVLDLSDNAFPNVYTLQNLNKLTQLNLSGNSQLQAFEVQDIIQNNPGLTHIGVANITMGDLNWLPPTGPQGEYNLVELDISYTGSLFDISVLQQYTNLRILKAAGTQLQTAYSLDLLVQLEVLDLSDNALFDVYPLQNLHKLTQLNLSGNSQLFVFDVQQIIRANQWLTHIGVANIAMNDLSWLPAKGYQGEYNLVELDISNTGAFFDLSPLLQYTDLRVLKAAGNQLTEFYPIDQLQQLEVVDLSDNDLRNVSGLGSLMHLSSLDLRMNDNIQCPELDALEAQLQAGVLLKPQSCIYLTAPDIIIMSPIGTGPYFQTDSINFVADAFDAEDGDLDTSVQWSSNIDGVLGSGGSLATSVSAGEHIITATVVDSHGNTTSASISLDVQPNTAPQLNIISIHDYAIFNEGEIVVLTADANDMEEGNISANIQWSSSRDGLLGTGSTVQTVLSVGSHLITASISDATGATVKQSHIVYINALPTLTLESPLNGAVYMVDESIELLGKADDLEDGDISETIQWSSDIDGVLGTGSALIKTLSLGTHTVTASVTDTNGSTRWLTTQVVIEQIDISLTVSGKGKKKTATVNWSGSRTLVDLYINGVVVGTAANTGSLQYRFKGQALFKVCETGTNYCSVELLAQ